MRTLLAILATTALLALAGGASAQIVNGDFEAGGAGWNLTLPPGWSGGFPPAGGNPGGYAHIQSPFGDSAGAGCISQVFQCGEPGAGTHCAISFDYFLRNIDASPLSGRVEVHVDGVRVFSSPPADNIPWNTVSFEVPCGEHEIQLCLVVDPQNNGWEAGFDNVSAMCDDTVPAGESTWSTVKTLY